ncbi:hypothetical protein NNL21_28960 [Paenibacillus mendelii]|nr:hypothetical protein [Paenibacillus mendelii]
MDGSRTSHAKGRHLAAAFEIRCGLGSRKQMTCITTTFINTTSHEMENKKTTGASARGCKI